VVISSGDYLRLYGMVAFTLLAGLGLLAGLIGKLRVAQAIKLGEE